MTPPSAQALPTLFSQSPPSPLTLPMQGTQEMPAPRVSHMSELAAARAAAARKAAEREAVEAQEAAAREAAAREAAEAATLLAVTAAAGLLEERDHALADLAQARLRVGELSAALARSRCEAPVLLALALDDVEELEQETKHALERVGARVVEARVAEAHVCAICFERTKNTAFVPCGHQMCGDCAAMILDECPFCKTAIEKKMRTY